MNPKYLNLSRSQLSVAWQRSRFNHYSDKRKQQFHDSIGGLYARVIELNFEDPAYSDDELFFFKMTLEFSKTSLSLLDNNTISSVPHEFIECLNVAAKQWIPDFDKYIIVMKDGPYAIMPQVDDIQMLYTLFESKFGIKFNHILLSVVMPRQLSRDYFTNVCLFHELGHFIDTKYKISEIVCTELRNQWVNGKDKELSDWFMSGQPVFLQMSDPKGTTMVYTMPFTKSYIKEYFADLFAAQYVGDKYLYFLDYMTSSPKTDGERHPSYEKRQKMFQDFCTGHGANPVLDVLLDKTQSITSQNIEQRFIGLSSDDMMSLLPTILNNEQEMLSIFNMGWESYMAGSTPFEQKNNLSSPLSPDRLYEAVNNLIEKSINNYLVIRDWNNAKLNS